MTSTRKTDRKRTRKPKPTIAYTITGGKPNHTERIYDPYPVVCYVE